MGAAVSTRDKTYYASTDLLLNSKTRTVFCASSGTFRCVGLDLFLAFLKVKGIRPIETVHNLKVFTLCDQLAVGTDQLVLLSTNFSGSSIRPFSEHARDVPERSVGQSKELIALGHLLGIVVLGDDRDLNTTRSIGVELSGGTTPSLVNSPIRRLIFKSR